MIDSKDFNQLKADKVDDPNSDKPIDPRFYFSAAEYNALLLRVQELSKFQDRSSNMGIRILGRKSSLEDLDKVISPRLGDAYLINDNLWIYDGISNTKPYGWSNIGKIHGTGREVIYKRTLEYITPDTPEAEDNERQTDNDYPKDWTGAPLGAVVSEPYEWESVRTRGTGVWSEYSEPAIHSKYTESGKMIKLTSSSNIIKKSLDSISPEVITVKGMAIGDVEISTWLYRYNEAPGGYSILVPGKSHIVGVVLTGDTITIDTKAFLQANSDFETIEFKAQDTTESIYDIEGITKLIQGDDVRLTLNNSNTSVGVTSEGVAYNYDDTDVYLKTYQGTNKLVYDKVGINIGTYKVEITVSEGVKGVDFESPLPEIINGDCWVDDITNMKNGVNSSYREFIVTGTDLNNKAFGPLTIRQQIRAVKDGDDGIDGIDGNDGKDGKDGVDGEDAYSVKLSKEQHIFIFNNQNDILPKGGWDKGNVEVSASKGSKTYTCNSFIVGERPSLPNTYTVKSISKNGISSYEASLYKSNFQFYPIGLSNPDGNNSLTLQVETLDDNATYKTFEVTVKYERVNDGLAGLGVPVTFRGDWDEAKKYYGSDIRLDITKYGDMYYKTRNFSGSETIGVVTGPPNVDTEHWEEFGEYFESVATSLLYAEQANIANFAFSEETMYSQSGYLTNADGSVDYTRPQEDGDSTLPNFRSNLLLRGKTGELQALTGYIGGFNISKGRLMSTKGTTPSLILDGVTGTISVGETVKIQSSGTISNLAKWALNADGSGNLAGDNIKWNAAGEVTLGTNVSLSWENNITDKPNIPKVQTNEEILKIWEDSGYATYINADGVYTKEITSLGKVTAGSFSLGSGNFIVDSSGKLNAKEVNISGHIEATSGDFKGDITARRYFTPFINLEDSDAVYIPETHSFRLGNDLNIVSDGYAMPYVENSSGWDRIELPYDLSYVGVKIIISNTSYPPYTRVSGSLRETTIIVSQQSKNDWVGIGGTPPEGEYYEHNDPFAISVLATIVELVCIPKIVYDGEVSRQVAYWIITNWSKQTEKQDWDYKIP